MADLYQKQFQSNGSSNIREFLHALILLCVRVRARFHWIVPLKEILTAVRTILCVQ